MCKAEAAAAAAYTGTPCGGRSPRTNVGKAARYELGLVLLELPGEAQVVEQGQDVGLVDCARVVDFILCIGALGLFLALLGHGDQVASG